MGHVSLYDLATRQVARFCRQYDQLETELEYPDPEMLRREDVQNQIYAHLFGGDAKRRAQPAGRARGDVPSQYRIGILKKLLQRVEVAIDGDYETFSISDNLVAKLSHLLSTPQPDEWTAAQQKSHVTFHLSCLSATADAAAPPHYDNDACPRITLLEQRSLVSAAGTTGLRTWEASLHLGQYLLAAPSLIRGRRILELGAGTGYLSVLCAARLSAAHVLATDGSDDVMANLAGNFLLNGLEKGDPRAQIAPLVWGRPLSGGDDDDSTISITRQSWDVVLGADLTYDRCSIPDLVATLDEVAALNPRATVLIAATKRNHATFEAFVEAARRVGFACHIMEGSPVPPRSEQTGPFYFDRVPIHLVHLTRSAGGARKGD